MVTVLMSCDDARDERPAVIDRYFVIHHLHWTLLLTLIVYTCMLDRDIQSAMETLPSLEKV